MSNGPPAGFGNHKISDDEAAGERTEWQKRPREIERGALTPGPLPDPAPLSVEIELLEQR